MPPGAERPALRFQLSPLCYVNIIQSPPTYCPTIMIGWGNQSMRVVWTLSKKSPVFEITSTNDTIYLKLGSITWHTGEEPPNILWGTNVNEGTGSIELEG